MSYALGQAKWIPGQIHFMTTRTGKLPNVQPLIEAGLPYAPYIEHGSWITGQPDIARYGRDPYRGISGLGQEDLTGEAREQAEATAAEIRQAASSATRELTQGAILISLGAFVGGAAGAAAGALKRPVLGGILGAIGGGILGYLAKQKLAAATTPGAVAGLHGILAVT